MKARPQVVLVAGISTRGLVESAARAGYHVVAIDGFADLDLVAHAKQVVRARTPGARFTAQRAVRHAQPVAADWVAYTAPFENHPAAVARLSLHRSLLGNSPDTLRAVRDPLRLSRTLRRLGLPAPRVRKTPPITADLPWLVKPRRSGGGHGIAVFDRAKNQPRSRTGTYYQERIAGEAGSLLFAADGTRARLLGMTRLLAGDRAFGAPGFRYAGNILSSGPESVARRDASQELVSCLTREFGLVGVNGIDVIWRGTEPYTLEINPRYTAAMELLERFLDISVFTIHVAACAGTLPAPARHTIPEAFGKAIVYAREPVVIGDTTEWLDDPTVRDIPAPHSRFLGGDPICTVFARAPTAARCHQALASRARQVYRALTSASRRRRA